MTTKLTDTDKANWLRKLDRATTAHEKTRIALEELVADARNAGVPLMTIANHTPWSREWCRKIADRIDAEQDKGETAPEGLPAEPVANPKRTKTE